MPSKRVLYLGLQCPPSTAEKAYVHCPLIRCTPRDISALLSMLQQATHIIFTSKTAVTFLANVYRDIKDKSVLSVGQATSSLLRHHGCINISTATIESQEGMVELIQQMRRDNVKLLLIEPYFDLKTPNSIARETGGSVVVLLPSVGGEKQVTDYFKLFDYDIALLVKAFNETK